MNGCFGRRANVYQLGWRLRPAALTSAPDAKPASDKQRDTADAFLKRYLQFLEMAEKRLQDSRGPFLFSASASHLTNTSPRCHCEFVGTTGSSVAPGSEFVIASCSIIEHLTCAQCFDKHYIDDRLAYQVQRLSCLFIGVQIEPT
jgi:hypothetical protein